MSVGLPILDEVGTNAARARPGHNGESRSAYVETYGCQMNVADTEVIRSLLNTAGFERAGSIDEADVVLLNT